MSCARESDPWWTSRARRAVPILRRVAAAVVTGADPTAALCLLAAMVPPVVEDRPPGEDVSRVVGLLRPR